MSSRPARTDHRGSMRALLPLLLAALTSVHAGWTAYSSRQMLLDNADFNDLAVQGSSVLWGATEGGGVTRFDGVNWTNYNQLFADILHNDVNVICVCRDSSDAVWFGTAAGVSVYRSDSTWVHYTTADGLAANRALSIAVDGNNRKWIGTDGGGVSLFDGSAWTTYTPAHGLADSVVNAVAVDAAGAVWFGTNTGVSRLKSNVWTTYRTSEGLSDNRVSTVFVDTDGSKWFATHAGISVFNDASNAWRVITTPDTIGENIFYAIDKDRHGFYWFGSHRGGVKKYDGSAFVTTYFAVDGLATNTVRAIAIDSNGVRWFGTDNGLSRFTNDPPAFTSPGGPLAATEGVPFTYATAATDVNRDRVTYLLVSGPAGISMAQGTGLVSWTPSNDDVGAKQFVVAATDGCGDTVRLTVSVTVANVNDTPLVTSATHAMAIEDSLFSYTASAADSDDVPTISFITVPSWLSPSGSSLSGAPPEGTRDTIFDVVATDGKLADTMRVVVTVLPVNDPPVIVSTPPAVAYEDLRFSYTVVANDPDGGPIRYRLNMAPSGMTVDSATGVISWTPVNRNVGDTVVEVSAVDPWSASTAQRFALRVQNTNDLPMVVSKSPASDTVRVRLGDTVSLTVSGADDDGDSIVYQWRLDGTDGGSAGSSLWKTTSLSSGIHTVSVRLSDASGIGDSARWVALVYSPVELASVQLPRAFALMPAYPNPCRSTATFRYAVPAHKSAGTRVSLRIYDLKGQLVRVLDEGIRRPGVHTIVWQGIDNDGNEAAAGNFLYRFTSDELVTNSLLTIQ